MTPEDEPGGSLFRILIANEPYAYRDVLASVLRTLRPDIVICDPDSGDLCAEVERCAPHLVICSREACIPKSPERAWILLNPDGTGLAVLAVRKVVEEVQDIDFDGLLRLIDRAEKEMLPVSASW